MPHQKDRHEMSKIVRTIGIDVGGTFIKIGLVRENTILAQRILPTAKFSSSPKTLENCLVEAVRSLLHEEGRVSGIGVGIPGLVRYPEGVVQTCANLPGWSNVPLRAYLQRRLGIPAQVDNDANLMTLAEWRLGAGRGVENLVCLTLGTGVGGGLVLNGSLYRSRSGSSAEIGHVAVGEAGPRCSCGGRACLERYVGNRAILRYVRKRIAEGAHSRLSEMVGHQMSRLTPELIDQACVQGDRLARQTWEEAGRKIGFVLAKVVNLLGPDRIVIGGGIAKAGRWLFDPIRQTVRSRAMRQLADVPIVPARLGSSAGLLGAALLAREQA